MTTPLPNVMLALTVADAYALYAAGVADGSGESTPTLRGPLQALLTTLRGRYWDDHKEDMLRRLPGWLEAQQHLKERAV